MAEGLVAQDEIGLRHEGASDCHTLAHAARELVGIRVLEPLQPEPRNPLRRRHRQILLAPAEDFHGQANVRERRLPRQEPIRLEDRRHVAAKAIEVRVDVRPVDLDAATRGRRESEQQ